MCVRWGGKRAVYISFSHYIFFERYITTQKTNITLRPPVPFLASLFFSLFFFEYYDGYYTTTAFSNLSRGKKAGVYRDRGQIHDYTDIDRSAISAVLFPASPLAPPGRRIPSSRPVLFSTLLPLTPRAVTTCPPSLAPSAR